MVNSSCWAILSLHCIGMLFWGDGGFLLMIHFMERFPQDLVLEMKDSALFVKNNVLANKNRYDYTLVIPATKANRITMMHLMQQDLERYFGFKVDVERRKFPCLKLVAFPEARNKLRTKRSS